MGADLDVDIAGRRASFDPAASPAVRFGRADGIELVVPGAGGTADLHMSRHVGTFRFVDDTWTLENPAGAPNRTRPALEVVGLTGTSTTVPPGAATPLPGVGEIRWQTSTTSSYALRFRFAGVAAGAVRAAASTGGPATSQVLLTPREVDFCVVLAEPELFGSLKARRPTLAEVAARWYVSLGTVEKTLRHLRTKLTDVGLATFGDDQRVRDKTSRLAATVVELGLVTLDDWRWARSDGSRSDESPSDGSPSELSRWRPSADGPRFRP